MRRESASATCRSRPTRCSDQIDYSWGLRLLILLAPVIYAAHILEEAPGYVRWFNSVVHQNAPDNGHFFAGNYPSIAITAIVAIAAAATLNRGALLAMLAWLSYFMFANAIYHVTATLWLREYSPGTVTAVLLYIPYFSWFVWYLRSRKISAVAISAIVAIFALPMLIQTYAVVFRHTRFY